MYIITIDSKNNGYARIFDTRERMIEYIRLLIFNKNNATLTIDEFNSCLSNDRILKNVFQTTCGGSFYKIKTPF